MEGWDMTTINERRKQWMKKDEKLAWDLEFPLIPCNMRRGGVCEDN
jgi:hypothetical protein